MGAAGSGRKQELITPLVGDRGQPAWEKQPNETELVFGYFKFYRDLPPKERTLQAVADHFNMGEMGIRRHSRTHDWANRAALWMAHKDAVENEEEIEGIRRMKQRHFEVAEKAITLAAQELDKLVKLSKDNNKKLVIEPRDIKGILAEAVKIQAVAANQPSQITKNQVDTRSDLKELLENPTAAQALNNALDAMLEKQGAIDVQPTKTSQPALPKGHDD